MYNEPPPGGEGGGGVPRTQGSSNYWFLKENYVQVTLPLWEAKSFPQLE